MAEPRQHGCSCANILVPLMMIVGGVVGFRIGGGWGVLIGVICGLPTAFLLIIVGLGMAALLEPRMK